MIIHIPRNENAAIGAAIQSRRSAVGMARRELAEAIGLNVQTLSNYETGVHLPKFLRLAQIAKALDCKVGDLVGDIGVPDHDPSDGRDEAIMMEVGAFLLEAFASVSSPHLRQDLVRAMNAAAGEDDGTRQS